jgi:hypothetical protein
MFEWLKAIYWLLFHPRCISAGLFFSFLIMNKIGAKRRTMNSVILSLPSTTTADVSCG